MNDYLFLKIVLFSVCFGWVWVEKLTENYGLFDGVPQYYPSFLKRVLSCSFCLAGWISVFIVAFFGITIENLPYLFAAPFFAIVGVQFIKNGK